MCIELKNWHFDESIYSGSKSKYRTICAIFYITIYVIVLILKSTKIQCRNLWIKWVSNCPLYWRFFFELNRSNHAKKCSAICSSWWKYFDTKRNNNNFDAIRDWFALKRVDTLTHISLDVVMILKVFGGLIKIIEVLKRYILLFGTTKIMTVETYQFLNGNVCGWFCNTI